MATTGSDHWNTPQPIVDLLYEFNDGPPLLDPCSNPRSLVRAEFEWFGPPHCTNGLITPWSSVPRGGNRGLVFVNPPYSAKAIWMRKCLEESRGGHDVIALIPADTDTNYFHDFCRPALRRCFLRGRLVFVGVKSKPESARFPSVLVYWGRLGNNRFHKVFDKAGWVV